MTEPWWKTAVVYQIYPRSFRDTTGDGVGDLRGIIDGLDHLEWLGVDALWLSPVFRSPMVDHGYDVSDYCDIDPVFGSLADMDELIDQAHERGLKVLLDWVPNHTSDQHPWFLASRSSRDDPKRGWYVWRDGTPDELPNDWSRAFPPGEPAWSWDEATQAWFLHLFAPEQPDLNWDDPDVRPAMLDTLRFWLDRGVDGFRMDVIHLIGKGDDLPELTPDEAKAPTAMHRRAQDPRAPASHPSGARRLPRRPHVGGRGVPPRPRQGGRVLRRRRRAAPLVQLRAAVQPLARRQLGAQHPHRVGRARRRRPLGHVGAVEPRQPAAPHPLRRRRAHRRAAAVLLLTLRGTPFLYAGEELGLEDADVPPERHVDPSGGRRDGCRAPIPWTREPGARLGRPRTPGSRSHPSPTSRNAATLRDDPSSILHLYRDLLAAPASRSPALQLGVIEVLDSPDDVLVYERRHERRPARRRHQLQPRRRRPWPSATCQVEPSRRIRLAARAPRWRARCSRTRL